MAQPIKIKLDTSRYKAPADDEIAAAKRFINLREEYAGVLGERIDDVLRDGAARIVEICYRYDVDPKLLYFSSAFNADMMGEIADVMDDIEQTILNLIYEYSTRVTDDRDKMSALAAWTALLGKGGRNLRDTLDGYLYKTMKDWEAAIAALRYAGRTAADATTRVITHLHSIYTVPEVTAAFKRAGEFAATYIRSRGVQYGAVGISNNGSTNVVNMGKITLQLAWRHQQQEDFNEEGAEGYVVLRGSGYDCDQCDENANRFHPITDLDGWPPLHSHCCCVAVPVHNAASAASIL